MKKETIYKEAIKKELEKVYNLWWKELLKIQASFVKELEWMFKTWYTDALKAIRNNIEVQMNDWVLESVEKTYSEEQLSKFDKYFEKSFKVGAKKLDLSTSKEPWVDVKLWIKQKDAEDYARDFAWKQITNIDATTTKRINKLVNHGISEWWWYNRIASVLKKDYAFSSYRANLIASHEVGEAYLNWKNTQFWRYRKEYGVDGWKQWNSHRDDRTTEWCMHNDMQWWIPYSESFEAPWNTEKPTRFIGCRCNIVYNIFKPQDARTTKKNVEPHMLEQTKVNPDRWFDEWLKPENYNKYSTSVLPASYINTIWKKYTYKWVWRAYYNKSLWIINLWSQKAEKVARKYAEAHEVWHAFFEEKVLWNEEYFNKFKDVLDVSAKEFLELRKNKAFKDVFEQKYINRFAETLVDWFDDILKINNVSYTTKTSKIKTLKGTFAIRLADMSPTFRTQSSAFMDTLASLTKQTYGAWHTKSYFKRSKRNEFIYKSFTKLQAHEFFAHLNETHFVWNDIMEAIMPKTNQAMLEFYKNIWLTFE